MTKKRSIHYHPPMNIITTYAHWIYTHLEKPLRTIKSSASSVSTTMSDSTVTHVQYLINDKWSSQKYSIENKGCRLSRKQNKTTALDRIPGCYSSDRKDRSKDHKSRSKPGDWRQGIQGQCRSMQLAGHLNHGSNMKQNPRVSEHNTSRKINFNLITSLY